MSRKNGQPQTATSSRSPDLENLQESKKYVREETADDSMFPVKELNIIKNVHSDSSS
jgi:hypothetical protein